MRDFIQRQQRAENRTGYLVLLMALAIGLTILVSGSLLSYFAVLLVYLETFGSDDPPLWTIFAVCFLIAALGTVVIVAVGALWKAVQLKRGGAAVAEGLGGLLIDETNVDPRYRQLLNVVQEVAVAVGIRAPAVYVLEDERGINAFAAGYSPHEAVIGVTRGAIESLTRDQLQGVIAHETGHIVNGDTRLNMHALAALHGLLAISIVAEQLIEMGKAAFDSWTLGSRHASGLELMALGAVLYPVGMLGAFGAAIVTAGINRQREYLADATAVEFTRNPCALADALKVIAGFRCSSRIKSPQASELNHLFFASSWHGMARLLATHPSIVHRIVLLDPEWDGIPTYEDESHVPENYGVFESSVGLMGRESDHGQPDAAAAVQATEEGAPADVSDTSVDACLAQWQSEQFEQVRVGLPAGLLEFAGDPQAAGVAVFGLVFGIDGVLSERELGLLPSELQPTVSAFLPLAAGLDPAQRTLLMDQALRSLARMPGNDRSGVDAAVEGWKYRDAETWAERGWIWLLKHADWQQSDERPRVRYGTLQPVREHCQRVLCTLVQASGAEAMMAEYTFHRAAAHLELDHLEWIDVSEHDPAEFFESLDQLAATAVRCRRQLLLATSLCLTADGQITVDEAVLLRVLCLALGFPLPTLLPGQRVVAGC